MERVRHAAGEQRHPSGHAHRVGAVRAHEVDRLGGERAQDLGWRIDHGLMAPSLQPLEHERLPRRAREAVEHPAVRRRVAVAQARGADVSVRAGGLELHVDLEGDTWNLQPIALSGVYYEGHVSSFTAEALALYHASAFMASYIRMLGFDCTHVD